MSSTTFTRGDAINVYYPPEDPYYHGTFPAYFIKEYKGSNCSRVLWVGECEFKNSTTTVKNKYITLDAKRSRASDEFIKLKAEASDRVDNLDHILKNKVKESIYRYMKVFNLT